MPILESARKVIEEMADNAFCEALYKRYLNSPDKDDFIPLEDFAAELGIKL